MADRDPFGSGDQHYLREVQYADATNLEVRSRLHRNYSTSPVPFAQFAAGLVDWAQAESVLECGCGSGRFWDHVELARSARLTLTDLSPGMVDEALARVCRGGEAIDVDGRVCDVQSLPFDDHSFDVVVANHMLYHAADPDRAVEEMARVVRRDGVLLAATNGSGHMREVNEAIAEVFGDHGEALDAIFGIDTGEARLRERFASVVWHAFDNDLIVDEPAAVVAYALSFPPGELAVEAQRADFVRAIERRFVDGTLRIHTRAGAFVCRSPRIR